MAEEGYYYESRFVCKLCNKKFPCGKSLGGHMRSHVVANPAESAENSEKKISSFDDFVQQSDLKDSKIAEFANGQQSSYVLRENPKRTWRAVGNSRIPLPQDKICKQCGKGFQSMKALCGHMACHSERDKNLKDDSSWTSENQKAVFDSCSDSEEAEERRTRTRSSSKNKRYKKFVEKSHFFALASNNVNGSSSVSEIDGQDQEEVAMCLMLLSRDFGNNSVVESSDNNSVVLETKSSSIEMMIGRRESLNYIQNQDEEKIGNKKLKGKILDDENVQVEDSDSDSAYFLGECAKAESDLSVDGFRKYGAFGECKNEDYGVEFRKSLKVIKNELRKFSKDCEYDDNDEFRDDSRKISKYECYNCKKAFKSYQALGGHRPCHKRMNAYYEPRYESGENSLDDSTDCNKKKSSAQNLSRCNEKKTKLNKNKSHVCPFCNRVFKNGQALGGHKRSHFIGGHLENDNQTKTKAHDLLDLNLPAPEADGDNEQRGHFDF